MICVSISDPAQLEEVLGKGFRMVEFRFDLISAAPAEVYQGLPREVRSIATCRPGPYSDPERTDLLLECMQLGAAFVDIELEAHEAVSSRLLKAAGHGECEVVISHHDFEKTPSFGELKEILESCFARGADLAKIATQVNGSGDLLQLVSVHRLPGRKVILGMGDKGRISRVMGPYLGSEFTFASPTRGNETAPGQISAADLKAMFQLIETK